jgi:hypothetical protein
MFSYSCLCFLDISFIIYDSQEQLIDIVPLIIEFQTVMIYLRGLTLVLMIITDILPLKKKKQNTIYKNHRLYKLSSMEISFKR